MQIEEDIKATLAEHIELNEVHVQGDGSHFQVIAVSDAFADLSRVKKQQMVYKPLSEKIKDGSVHALSIKAFTPEEWDKQRVFHNV
jgi:acid stress-induced BolA-like protein IbaG/YrbA